MQKRREFLKSLSAMPAVAALAQEQKRPNVLIILTDDQGYGDFGCHGNPVLKTPNMDKLHSQSLRFTDFHSAPMCTPTRGQLMTGLDALYNGATSVTAGRAMLRRGIPTMADIFGSNGYSTGIFGKWHLGDNYPYRPMDRGFQEAKYFFGFGLSSAPEFNNDYFNGTYRHNGKPKKFDGYCTDFWFGEAMSWMEKQSAANKPFFCYLPTNAPHGPAWVDEKYAAPYRKDKLPAQFFGMIANLDENLGKLETFLEEKGLRENTVVIFMTDNGATAGFSVFNAGMRGRKTMIYEGGHRVPCFVSWPAGRIPAGTDNDTPAQMQDLLPTLIDLLDLRNELKATFDGRSLAKLIRARKDDFSQRMMVVQYGQIPVKWDAAVIWGKWRLVRGEELYNLGTDPGQTSDVAKTNAGVLKKMKDHYERWWTHVEPGLKNFATITLGSDVENPVRLCSSDWQDIYCDNPGHVSDAAGGPRGGPWNVFVERDGTYEIELHRWIPELGLSLTAGREIQKMTVGQLPAGKALPIAGAKLTVAGQQLEGKSKLGDKFISLKAKLKGGTKTQLHAWFQDAQGNDISGVFYAVVRRV